MVEKTPGRYGFISFCVCFFYNSISKLHSDTFARACTDTFAIIIATMVPVVSQILLFPL